MEGSATNLLMGPGVEAGVCNYRDVTERKLAEERIQQSEERYRVLVEQASVGIFLADLEGHYLEVNPSGCTLFGCSREELLASSIQA